MEEKLKAIDMQGLEVFGKEFASAKLANKKTPAVKQELSD